MTATWPDTLPQRYRIDGNAEAPEDGRLITQNDAGPPKVRARTSATTTTITASMRMSGAQWAILQAFGAATLGGWALPFTMSASDSDDPWLVLMGTIPSRVNIGGDRWNVSFSLTVLP